MAPPPPPKGSVGDEEARAHPSTSPQPAWRPNILTPMTELSSHFFDMGRPSNPLPGGIVSAEPGATAERTSGPSPGPSSFSWGTQPEPNSLDKIFEHQSEQQQQQQPRENPRCQKGSDSDKPHWWQA
ncbi:hypothetical protein FA10DRAFT_264050 [Acaromyces ingoldii]|uniref:Uncharacterized protein n=1 Tax=Acaromyces ingoldii TaxID=215250 RepID=A0A316YZY8_9BASI|nr:hypothetical protein FA10DRAFT_264050 [Acaromyces ingoldii]PWN93395.1 hypothetical protein FA10DRAFT_264050 [Acaromyces ingoldii]